MEESKPSSPTNWSTRGSPDTRTVTADPGEPTPKVTEQCAISDVEKRIAEAFEVFDHAGNKTVDVREVGTILRSLGCVPNEAEIQEIIVNVEDQETSGSVHLDRFLPYVSQILHEYKLQPASAEELLKALQTLDVEGTGYITKEHMTQALKEGHEPFTQEEIDEMLDVAVDPRTNLINYELYINQIMLAVEDKIPENDIYSLVEMVQSGICLSSSSSESSLSDHVDKIYDEEYNEEIEEQTVNTSSSSSSGGSKDKSGSPSDESLESNDSSNTLTPLSSKSRSISNKSKMSSPDRDEPIFKYLKLKGKPEDTEKKIEDRIDKEIVEFDPYPDFFTRSFPYEYSCHMLKRQEEVVDRSLFLLNKWLIKMNSKKRRKQQLSK